MVYSQTKNPNLGQFGRVLQLKMLAYFMAIWYSTYEAIWYILWRFGIFFSVLVCCTKNNLATLVEAEVRFVTRRDARTFV
jgi:hypothetical protein